MFADGTPPTPASGHQPQTLHGDLIAIGTGFCLASYVTFIRYCAKFRPGAAIDAAPSIGNFLAGGIALVMSRSVCGGVTHGVNLPGFLPVVGTNAVLVAIFYVGFTLAPRYITGAEVALILLMETVCGPLWVFLRFGDAPSVWTLAGGAVLIVALAVHEIVGLREMRPPSGLSADLTERLDPRSPGQPSPALHEVYESALKRLGSPVLRLTASPPSTKRRLVSAVPAESGGAFYHRYTDSSSS